MKTGALNGPFAENPGTKRNDCVVTCILSDWSTSTV